MKIKVFLLFLLFIFSFLKGENETSNFYFNEANILYEKGDYSEALKKYLEIYNNGWESGDLLYNISNTYFRKGEKGKALLFLERAKKLNPRNFDIIYNRKYLYELFEENRDNFLDTINFFTKHEIFNIFLILNALFWILFILKRKLKYLNNHFTYLHFIIIFLMIINLFYGFVLFFFDKKNYAITIERDSPCFAEPNTNSKALFTIPEAKKLLVLDNINSFTEIYLEKEELKGWIDSKNIEII